MEKVFSCRIGEGCFTPHGAHQIKKISDALLPYAIKMDGRNRTGFYLTIADNRGRIIFFSMVGNTSEADAEKFCINSQKKTVRLVQNPKHVSGWQTRVFEKGDYGGSIRDASGMVFGVSGFSEHVDEALSAAISCGLDEESMPLERQNQIAEISGNSHLIELCEKGADWEILPKF